MNRFRKWGWGGQAEHAAQSSMSSSRPLVQNIWVGIDWFYQQDGGFLEAFRDLCHNAKAVGSTLNASKFDVTLYHEQVANGVTQLCLAVEDNGRGFSFEELLGSLMLKPRSAPAGAEAGQLSFYGEGMKTSLVHMMAPKGSFCFGLTMQGEEWTVVMLSRGSDGNAEVVLLPIPRAFVDNPGDGTTNDLLSHVAEEDCKADYQKVLEKMCRQPASTGGISGLNPNSPYNWPIDFVKVFQAMQQRSVIVDKNGGRQDVYNVLSTLYLPEEGQQLHPSGKLVAPPHAPPTHAGPYRLRMSVLGREVTSENHAWHIAVREGARPRPHRKEPSAILTIRASPKVHAQQLVGREQLDIICTAGNQLGRDRFLYPFCLDGRIALVQLASTQHGTPDRSKLNIEPLDNFAQALMRTLATHSLQGYLDAGGDRYLPPAETVAGPSSPTPQQRHQQQAAARHHTPMASALQHRMTAAATGDSHDSSTGLGSEGAAAALNQLHQHPLQNGGVGTRPSAATANGASKRAGTRRHAAVLQFQGTATAGRTAGRRQQDRADVILTSDKEGPESEFEKHLPEAEIVVTTPFHPAYITKDLLKKAHKLKLVLTAGIGSDHVDLQAAADNNLTVAEVTGSNTTSVAEDNVLRIVLLMRNFLPALEQIKEKKWDVPAVAAHAHDMMGMTVGTVGGGAIGLETMKRLRGWEVKRLYFDRKNNEGLDKEGVTLVKDMGELLGQCDAVTICIPLTPATKGMFDKDTIGKMKKGAYLINNARGAIVDKHAVVEALESGQLAGYSGDVWDQQPPPKDHPWSGNPGNLAMTPHVSGTTLEAQQRYQEGIHDMVNAWFDGKPFDEVNYIVREGEIAPQYQ
ncbi:hypothetical protein WJX73_009721 [Symbiochloris irregularis]|uniref:Formate dehydrogenase n=1 Tax=Symbiochloris irregularis TaxID=706552 RepID=A0AAW1PF78_9CHLO